MRASYSCLRPFFFFSCSSPLWLNNSCSCRVCGCLSLDFSCLYPLLVPAAPSTPPPPFSVPYPLPHVNDVTAAPPVGVWVKFTGLPFHPGHGALLCRRFLPNLPPPPPPIPLSHLAFFERVIDDEKVNTRVMIICGHFYDGHSSYT